MRKNEPFRFGVRETLRRKFKGINVRAVSQLTEDEFVACGSRDMYYMAAMKPPARFPYKLTLCQLLPDDGLIVGITAGIPNFVFMGNRTGFPLVADEYRLNDACISQMIVSRHTNTIIIAGSGVEVYHFRVKYEANTIKPTIVITKKASIPSEDFGSHLCHVYLDEPGMRMLVPTLTGYKLYSLSGTLLQNADKLSPSPFRTSCCIHVTKKGTDTRSAKADDGTVVDPFKVFMSTDGDGTVRVWSPSGRVFNTFRTSARSFLFTEFVNSEFVICVTSNKQVMLMDVKTGKHVPLLDLPGVPEFVEVVRKESVKLMMIIDHEVFVYDVIVLWRKWATTTSLITSIRRFPSAHGAARIVVVKENDTFDMFQPKNRQLLSNSGLVESAKIKCFQYDRGCIASDNQMIATGSESNRVMLLLENQSLCDMCPAKNNFTVTGKIDIKAGQMTIVYLQKMKTHAFCFFSGRGDMFLCDSKDMSLIKRVIVYPDVPLFCFYHVASNCVIAVYRDKLSLISVDTYLVVESERIDMTIHADYDDDTLILASENDVVRTRKIRDGKIVDPEVYEESEKIACVACQYGCFAYATERNMVRFGRTLAETGIIELPHHVYALGFLNRDLDLLIGLDHEIMVLPRDVFPFISSSPAAEMDDDNPEKEELMKLRFDIQNAGKAQAKSKGQSSDDNASPRRRALNGKMQRLKQLMAEHQKTQAVRESSFAVVKQEEETKTEERDDALVREMMEMMKPKDPEPEPEPEKGAEEQVKADEAGGQDIENSNESVNAPKKMRVRKGEPDTDRHKRATPGATRAAPTKGVSGATKGMSGATRGRDDVSSGGKGHGDTAGKKKEVGGRRDKESEEEKKTKKSPQKQKIAKRVHKSESSESNSAGENSDVNYSDSSDTYKKPQKKQGKMNVSRQDSCNDAEDRKRKGRDRGGTDGKGIGCDKSDGNRSVDDNGRKRHAREKNDGNRSIDEGDRNGESKARDSDGNLGRGRSGISSDYYSDEYSGNRDRVRSEASGYSDDNNDSGDGEGSNENEKTRHRRRRHRSHVDADGDVNDSDVDGDESHHRRRRHHHDDDNENADEESHGRPRRHRSKNADENDGEDGDKSGHGQRRYRSEDDHENDSEDDEKPHHRHRRYRSKNDDENDGDADDKSNYKQRKHKLKDAGEKESDDDEAQVKRGKRAPRTKGNSQTVDSVNKRVTEPEQTADSGRTKANNGRQKAKRAKGGANKQSAGKSSGDIPTDPIPVMAPMSPEAGRGGARRNNGRQVVGGSHPMHKKAVLGNLRPANAGDTCYNSVTTLDRLSGGREKAVLGATVLPNGITVLQDQGYSGPYEPSDGTPCVGRRVCMIDACGQPMLMPAGQPNDDVDDRLYDARGQVITIRPGMRFRQFREMNHQSESKGVRVVYNKAGKLVGFMRPPLIDSRLEGEEHEAVLAKDVNGMPVICDDGNHLLLVAESTTPCDSDGESMYITNISCKKADIHFIHADYSVSNGDQGGVNVSGFELQRICDAQGRFATEYTFFDPNGAKIDSTLLKRRGFVANATSDLVFADNNHKRVTEVFQRDGQRLSITGVCHIISVFHADGTCMSQTVFRCENGRPIFMEDFTSKYVFTSEHEPLPQRAIYDGCGKPHIFGSLTTPCHEYFDNSGSRVEIPNDMRVSLFKFSDKSGEAFRRKLVFDKCGLNIGYLDIQGTGLETRNTRRIDFNGQTTHGQRRVGDTQLLLPCLMDEPPKTAVLPLGINMRQPPKEVKEDSPAPNTSRVYNLMAMRRVAFETAKLRKTRALQPVRPLGNVEMALNVVQPTSARPAFVSKRFVQNKHK